MSPLTKNPYIFHKYPNSANRNIKKAIKAIKILTFYQQRRTPWYHVCEKQQRANSGQGWHFCHAQWTSNGYSYFRSSFTTSAFLYLKLPNLSIDDDGDGSYKIHHKCACAFLRKWSAIPCWVIVCFQTKSLENLIVIGRNPGKRRARPQQKVKGNSGDQ